MSGTTSAASGKGSISSGPPSEITAEWTVHAQLTLSSSASATPNNCISDCKVKQKEPSVSGVGQTNNVSDDHSAERKIGDGAVSVDHEGVSSPQPTQPDNIGTSSGSGNPVKVVYKFSTTDNLLQQNSQKTASTSSITFPLAVSGPPSVGKSNVIFNNDPSSPAPSAGVAFVQTPPGNAVPLLDGDTSGQANLFPKCTSTCSIVLTACTDLLPTTDALPIIIKKCESSNNVVDKSTNFPEKFPNSGKDVSCQTSDWECTDPTSKNIKSECELGGSMRRRSAQKSVTECALLSPPPRRRDDRIDSLQRKSVSSNSPNNTIRSQQSSILDTSAAKKKPRTVHIDVYCTGSDAESSSSSCYSSNDDDEPGSKGDNSSSCSSGSRFDTSHMMELRSNSNTGHPTIFESEEMKVRHRRAGKHDVPRRLMQQAIDQNTLSTIGSLKKSAGMPYRHGRNKKYAASDEINESKQILFSKHLGSDETKATEVKDFGVYFQRDASDDTISSNYAISNRSTRRDITGSSLSSVMAGGIYEDDVQGLEENTIQDVKLNRSATSGTQSDSFEYDNSEDRYRILEMEHVWNQHHWKSPSVERKLLELHNPRNAGKRSPTLFRSDSENNLTESDHSFVYDDSPSSLRLQAVHHESNPSLNEFSDSSPSTVKSASQRTPEGSRALLQQQAVLAATLQQQHQPREFSPVEGYTNEYLAIARRFGSLIKGRRKPGTHMGPVRNPECPCAHCRRWIVEREMGCGNGTGGVRERAFSVDETSTPSNIVDMRRQLHMRNLL